MLLFAEIEINSKRCYSVKKASEELMSSYEFILFDLDGTLTDSSEGITRSVAHALESMGISVPDLDALCKFIGPPLQESFKQFYGLSESESLTAIKLYREHHFNEGGLFENVVYDGIRELLERLKTQGKTLIVATSKPRPYAESILEHFGLSQYFDFISGSELDGSRVDKAEVIDHALKRCGISDISKAIMVGDRRFDVSGARSNGLNCIGVLYGFGSREELEAAGADYIVETVSELEDLLCE
jgi:phosphoglycolate phosphatase